MRVDRLSISQSASGGAVIHIHESGADDSPVVYTVGISKIELHSLISEACPEQNLVEKPVRKPVKVAKKAKKTK